jgi:hypothetical protein
MEKCDFIGVLHNISGKSKFQVSKVNKSRLNMEIVDESGNSIIFTLWGREDFEIPYANKIPHVISIRNVKVSNFGQFSLNSNDESEI